MGMLECVNSRTNVQPEPVCAYQHTGTAQLGPSGWQERQPQLSRNAGSEKRYEPSSTDTSGALLKPTPH